MHEGADASEIASYDSTDDVARLRARVEQQSELISLMKKRSDGLIGELDVLYKSLDKEREMKEGMEQELLRKCQQLQEKDKQLCSVLAQRDKLVDNMKSLEDKLSSAKLHIESLQKEKDSLVTESMNEHEAVHSLESKLMTFKEQNRSCKDCIESLKSNLNETTTRYNDTLTHVTKLKKENKDLECHYAQVLKKLTKEKEDTLTLCAELKDEIQALSLESKKWQQKAASLEETISDTKAKLKQDLRNQTMKSSEGELLSSIKKELTFTKEKLAALEKEFSMFKKHSIDQLEHERQLNSKLRHLAL